VQRANSSVNSIPEGYQEIPTPTEVHRICCHPQNPAFVISQLKGSWMFLKTPSYTSIGEKKGREPDDIVSCSVSYDFQAEEFWTKCFHPGQTAQLRSVAQ